jgi:hypothetical protein
MENIDKRSVHFSLLTNLRVKYAFPMLETDDEADDHQDRATLANKARFTPLSIMVCNTISAVWS